MFGFLKSWFPHLAKIQKKRTRFLALWEPSSVGGWQPITKINGFTGPITFLPISNCFVVANFHFFGLLTLRCTFRCRRTNLNICTCKKHIRRTQGQERCGRQIADMVHRCPFVDTKFWKLFIQFECGVCKQRPGIRPVDRRRWTSSFSVRQDLQIHLQVETLFHRSSAVFSAMLCRAVSFFLFQGPGIPAVWLGE